MLKFLARHAFRSTNILSSFCSAKYFPSRHYFPRDPEDPDEDEKKKPKGRCKVPLGQKKAITALNMGLRVPRSVRVTKVDVSSIVALRQDISKEHRKHRPGWAAILAEAYGRAGAEMEQLRQWYVRYPFERIYQDDVFRLNIAMAKQDDVGNWHVSSPTFDFPSFPLDYDDDAIDTVEEIKTGVTSIQTELISASDAFDADIRQRIVGSLPPFLRHPLAVLLFEAMPKTIISMTGHALLTNAHKFVQGVEKVTPLNSSDHLRNVAVSYATTLRIRRSGMAVTMTEIEDMA